MSKHICPRCGFEFGERNYDLVEEDDWSYFDFTGTPMYAVCDNCHQKFTKGYTKSCEPIYGINVDVKPLYRRRQYICSECAKKWDYVL